MDNKTQNQKLCSCAGCNLPAYYNNKFTKFCSRMCQRKQCIHRYSGNGN